MPEKLYHKRNFKRTEESYCNINFEEDYTEDTEESYCNQNLNFEEACTEDKCKSLFRSIKLMAVICFIIFLILYF